MQKAIFVSISIIALALLMMAGQGQAAGEALNVAIPTDPDSFDPAESVAAATYEIAFNIYEGLVKSTPDGRLEGALAMDWQVEQGGTRYVFTLRRAYFHNGRRVEPADVVNALERARNPETSKRASEFAVIDRIEAEGERIIITLKEPFSPFLFSLAEMAAVIYPREADNLATEPIGTGPYRFQEWRPNQIIRLQRFDKHWSGKRPYYETINLRIIPDENSAVLALKAGQIDVIPRLEPSLLHQVEGDPRFTVVSSPMNLVQLLALNNDRPPFDIPEVRRAVAMAVDKEEIVFGAAWGHGQVINSGISPAMASFYNDALQDVNSFDPAAARQLLVEAGHEDLSFTLDLPAPYGLHVQTGEIIAEQLKRIGIDVELRIVEWATWLQRVYEQRDYDATVIGFTGRLDPHAILNRYHSKSSRNMINFTDPEFDRLIDEGVTTSFDERPSVYREAQRILATKAASVFIMDPAQLTVVRQGIQGWTSYPIYVIDLSTLYR